MIHSSRPHDIIRPSRAQVAHYGRSCTDDVAGFAEAYEVVRRHRRVARSGMIGVGIGIPSAKGSTFSPIDILGLILWLRADLGIGLNGTDVASWLDQSGQGHHALQANPALQPPYIASDAGYGGQPVVGQFGVGDSLVSAPWGAPQAQPYTIYAAGNWPDQAAIRDMADFGMTGYAIIRSGFATMSWYANGGGVIGDVAVTSTPSLMCILGDDPNSEVYFNSLTRLGLAGAAGTQALEIVRLGENHVLGGQFEGKIAEIIGYAGVHSPAQRQLVMDYMSSRYQIPLLP